MLYLLDANVLIDANRDYYPLLRVPEFWEWLAAMGMAGVAKVPREIFEEIVLPKPQQSDPLVNWLNAHEDALVLREPVDPELVARVVERGYAQDLTDEEITKLGRDPFLIAFALADTNNRAVVTTERSRPSRTRANRHIPDVCDALGVQTIDTFRLVRELDFRTGWRTTF